MKKRRLLSVILMMIAVLVMSLNAHAVEGITTVRCSLRSTAGSGGIIIKSLNKGERVDIIGKTSNWYRVKYGDTEGYLRVKQVETDNVSEIEEYIETEPEVTEEDLLERIEELEKENAELRGIDLTEDEILLRNAANAYWNLFCHAKEPRSIKMISMSAYEDTIIVYSIGKESDGSCNRYMYQYHPDTDTLDSLGKPEDVSDKYKAGSDKITPLDNEKILEFSKSDKYSGYNILYDVFITEEEADKIIKENEEELEASSAQRKAESSSEETEAETERVTESLGNTYSDSATVRLVQQALNAAGFDCGTPDGVAGNKTYSAISAFEESKGITVNGIITDQLLRTLGIEEEVQKAIEQEASKNKYSTEYTYEQLARNPDTYLLKSIKVSGKVLQAGDAGTGRAYIRLAWNNDYNNVLFITYDKSIVDYRILDDDRLTIYGYCCSTYSYEAVSGATITLPWIEAEIIELN